MKLFIFIILATLSLNASAVTLQEAIDAAGAGQIETLKKYKEEKKDFNAQDEHGINPLMQAVATGQKDSVQFLLKQRPKLELKNDNHDTVVAMAIGNEQDDIAVTLFKAGAKSDVLTGENQSNLLFAAVSVNAEKSLSYLLKKSPKQLNEQNKKGDSPLHEAARFGTEQTLSALLKAGAKKDLKNNEGQTPLDVAKSTKNQTAIKLLSLAK